MKKTALLLLITTLVFGSLALAAEEVKVPFSAVKSSCYGKIDMTKGEFSLSEVGKECVTESWLEDNLPHEETRTEDVQKEEKSVNTVSFERSRAEIFDLLANPKKIEYSLDTAWKYSVSGWERSDLSSGKARWLTQSGELYNYELIGNPAREFTLIGGITGEARDSANYLVRAALVMRAIGVTKEDVGSILSDLINKAADNPNRKFERRVGDISVNLTFMPSISMLSLTLQQVDKQEETENAEDTTATEDEKGNEQEKLKKSVKQKFYDVFKETVNWENKPETIRKFDLIHFSSIDKYSLQIRYRASDNMTKGLIRDGIYMDAMEFIKKLYNDPDNSKIIECHLFAYLKLVDQYGNESEEQVSKISLDREVAEKINWENMYYQKFIKIVKNEGSFYLHSALK